MSAYGYERNTTPNFDKLAARSALFENAFSPSSNTFESAAQIYEIVLLGRSGRNVD